jgi:hypothetical protein
MNREELFDLQSTLVACLTSPNAVRESQSGVNGARRLSFLDPDLVDLLSSLYRGKRLDKLAKVFPQTLAYLASEMPTLTREFLARHPPLNADSYTAGCQFYGFLKRHWHAHPPSPPFLQDVAYCELARVALERQVGLPPAAALAGDSTPEQPQVFIRCRRGVRMRACGYDIRPLFDPDEQGQPAIARQPVWIVMSRPLAAASGRMYGVAEKLFALLGSWRRWTAVDLRSDSSVAEQTLGMLRQLEQLGFIEVRV